MARFIGRIDIGTTEATKKLEALKRLAIEVREEFEAAAEAIERVLELGEEIGDLEKGSSK